MTIDFEKYSEYVTNKAREVITVFGPRGPGSEGEKRAQQAVAEELKNYTDKVEIENFKLHPKAFMGWMPIAGVLMLFSVALYWYLAVIGAILSVVTIVIFFFEFLRYRQFIDPFFPAAESCNVIATKNPTGPKKRTMILCGHMDAAFEWRFSYIHPRLLQAVILYSLLGMLFVFVTDLVFVLAKPGMGVEPQGVFGVLGLVRLWFVPAFVAILFFSNFSRVVPGANDNLSGVYVSVALAKLLLENDITLANTELKVLISGSEEAGLRGAKAYVKRHFEQLRQSNADTVFLALETFRDTEFMAVYNRDLHGTLRHHPLVCKLLKSAAETCGVKLPNASVYIGSTDATAFTQAKIPAAAMAAMDPAPPRYYHTREDNYNNMNPECIQLALQIVFEAVTQYDKTGMLTGSKNM